MQEVEVAIVYAGFVGFLVDYFLGRFNVKDPGRIVVACIVAVVVGFLVYNGEFAII